MMLRPFGIIAWPGVMAALFVLAGSQALVAAQDIPTILRKSDTQLRATATYKVEADQTMARQAKISGVVGVRLVIGVDGNVETATAVSGPQLLRDWALSAARAWQWQPAVVGGLPVKVSGTLFFRFTADQSDDSNKEGADKQKQQGNEDRGTDGAHPGTESALDHFNQGMALEKDEKYQEAISAFQVAINLNPDLREAYLEIATIYGRLKRYDDQMRICTKALERFPGAGSDQFLAQLAAALGMMGKYE